MSHTDTVLRRSLVLVGFLITLLILGVLHGAAPPAPDQGVPPGNDELVAEYEDYTGERVVVDGVVISLDPVMIKTTGSYGQSVMLRIDSATGRISTGDYLVVYGIVHPDNRIVSIETVHKPSVAYWLTRVLSLIAGVWVLIRALKYWAFDTDRLRFRRRETPITLRTVYPFAEEN